MTAVARRELAREYLYQASHRTGWVLRDDDEVAGRFVWNGDGAVDPFHVVADGQALTWEELGNALEPCNPNVAAA